MDLQKNVSSMDSCIQITRIWRTLDEGPASLSSWTLNHINWIRISLGRYLDLVVVHSNQYKTPTRVSFCSRCFSSQLTCLWYYADPELTTTPYTNRSRRRSSCTPRQDPDEILKNLKAVKGELLGRSMSICGDKRGMRSNCFNYNYAYYIIKIIHLYIIILYWFAIRKYHIVFLSKGVAYVCDHTKSLLWKNPNQRLNTKTNQLGE